MEYLSQVRVLALALRDEVGKLSGQQLGGHGGTGLVSMGRGKVAWPWRRGQSLMVVEAVKQHKER